MLVSEFEDQLIEACQDNPDLSMCFSAYTEARGRVREKIRSRGFWPPIKGKGKNKGAKKGSWNPKGGFRKRQSLADRIANSHCRLCGARGHWRQECPNKGNASNPTTSSAEIHVSTLDGEMSQMDDQEVFEKLPISLENSLPDWWPLSDVKETMRDNGMASMDSTDHVPSELNQKWKDRLVEALKYSSHLCRDSETETLVNEEIIYAALSLNSVKLSLKKGLRDHMSGTRVRRDLHHEPVFFVDHGSSAILDTGASKSVIGKKRLEQLLTCLPESFAKKMSWQKSETVFRFGNNGTLKSLGAAFFPFGPRWLKIEVVDGATPFFSPMPF